MDLSSLERIEANRNRVVIHSDGNAFYATIETLYRPELRGRAVAVGGDPEARHGIVLTATPQAKKMGVKVGMALWQAKQACPQLIFVPPNYSLYKHISGLLNKIYYEYTNLVEPFGLDESWVEITGRSITIKDGEAIAHEIKERVKREIGITVSIGVSYNKAYAKLGSDLKKPDAVSVITPNNHQETVWPLPVSDLLFVGPATKAKLLAYNIRTIGDLANADLELLLHKFGKNAIMLKVFALGLDNSPTLPADVDYEVESVGNSMTTPFDIATLEDAKAVYYLLAESVGARLRELGMRSRCISISARTTDLAVGSCQRTIKHGTDVTRDIVRVGMSLFESRYQHALPMRSVGLRCSQLVPYLPEQLSLFDEPQCRIDLAMDKIHRRYGMRACQPGIIYYRPELLRTSPKEDHDIHPVALRY